MTALAQITLLIAVWCGDPNATPQAVLKVPLCRQERMKCGADLRERLNVDEFIAMCLIGPK